MAIPIAIVVAVVSFLLTFFAAKKAGVPTSVALLAAAGVSYGAYKLADNYQAKKDAPVQEVGAVVDAKDDAGQPIGTSISNAVGSVSDWIGKNPALAGGIALGGAGAAAGLSGKSWLPWALGAGALLLILK